ncbi:hypothetical protein B0H21DRAFT_706461 [Amylocystis lapponica]|nr:hypothetical protein B0H21DRAFT_706461 [Amylocystis lapponica]
MTPQTPARDVLAYAITRGTFDDFVPWMKAIVLDPNTPPTTLYRVMACFESIGMDFDAARRALNDMTSHHCVRCHKSFRVCDNGPDACVLLHTTPEGDEPIDGDGDNQFSCCGQEMDDSGENIECFRGWHTVRREEVDYMKSSAQKCSSKGCGAAAKTPVFKKPVSKRR